MHVGTGVLGATVVKADLVERRQNHWTLHLSHRGNQDVLLSHRPDGGWRFGGGHDRL